MPNEKQRFWGGFFSYLPRHGTWLEVFCGVSAGCLALQSISPPRAGPAVAAAGDAAAVLRCLQPPAPCPSVLAPGHAQEPAARALSPFQPGGGVGQSLSHAASRPDIKHGRSSHVALSVLWGVVTQLHSRFKGSFRRKNSLFPCWVML